MKVFMTGGTGFVGAYLSRELAQAGHAITILSRRVQPPAPPPTGISYLTGDPNQEGPWMAAVPEHDWIINLAGASIFSRWTEALKKEIFESRVRTTRNLVAALAAGDRRQLFCSTSAVGYYGPRGEEELTEDSPPDASFLGELSKAWEAEALKAQDLGVRVVVTRFGVVLGRGGGALGQMAPMFRKFLGGPIGSGAQWFSWIHQADHARAFRFIQANPEISGPVNLTAPQPGAQPGAGPRPGPGLAPAQLHADPGVHAAPGFGGIRRHPAHRAKGLAPAPAKRGLHLQFPQHRRGAGRFTRPGGQRIKDFQPLGPDTGIVSNCSHKYTDETEGRTCRFALLGGHAGPPLKKLSIER